MDDLLFTRYQVMLQVTNRLMAGVPKDPEMIATWLNARKTSEAAFARRQAAGEDMMPIAKIAERVEALVDGGDEGEEERVWMGFLKDEMGLHILASNVKAHLKDCANVLQKKADVKAFRSKLANRVFVEGIRNSLGDEAIYLGKDEPDGYFEHPVHAMTARGPRTALKRNDYRLRPLLAFTLLVLNDGFVTEELLETLFAYGAKHGIGSERGNGFGRYELVKLEALPK